MACEGSPTLACQAWSSTLRGLGTLPRVLFLPPGGVGERAQCRTRKEGALGASRTQACLLSAVEQGPQRSGVWLLLPLCLSLPFL